MRHETTPNPATTATRRVAPGEAIYCDGQIFARCALCRRLHIHGLGGGSGLRVGHCIPISRGSYVLQLVDLLDATHGAALVALWQADMRAAWRELGRARRGPRAGRAPRRGPA